MDDGDVPGVVGEWVSEEKESEGARLAVEARWVGGTGLLKSRASGLSTRASGV
jgi:hypothetical protein